MADIAELYALFTQVTDPRSPRGVRHGIATVMTVMVLVVLAGARNFRKAGDHAADLPDLLLHACLARRDPGTGVLVASSGSTLRRVVETSTLMPLTCWSVNGSPPAPTARMALTAA